MITTQTEFHILFIWNKIKTQFSFFLFNEQKLYFNFQPYKFENFVKEIKWIVRLSFPFYPHNSGTEGTHNFFLRTLS